MREHALSQHIYRFLILNGSVQLPGIGFFEIIRLPAIHDLNHQKIIAPSNSIRFTVDHLPSDNNTLLNYLVRSMKLPMEEASSLLTSFCAGLTEKMEQEQSVYWKDLGKLNRDSEGRISFEAEKQDPSLSPSISSSLAYEKNDENDMITKHDHEEFYANSKDDTLTGPTTLVSLNTALIIILIITLSVFMVRYSFGNFELFGSRYEKIQLQDPPSTYEVINK